MIKTCPISNETQDFPTLINLNCSQNVAVDKFPNFFKERSVALSLATTPGEEETSGVMIFGIEELQLAP